MQILHGLTFIHQRKLPTSLSPKALNTYSLSQEDLKHPLSLTPSLSLFHTVLVFYSTSYLCFISLHSTDPFFFTLIHTFTPSTPPCSVSTHPRIHYKQSTLTCLPLSRQHSTTLTPNTPPLHFLHSSTHIHSKHSSLARLPLSCKDAEPSPTVHLPRFPPPSPASLPPPAASHTCFPPPRHSSPAHNAERGPSRNITEPMPDHYPREVWALWAARRRGTGRLGSVRPLSAPREGTGGAGRGGAGRGGGGAEVSRGLCCCCCCFFMRDG